MKNTAKRTLSLLLALIMVLSLGTLALAANDIPATSISVKADKETIYYREGKAGTAALTATLQPSDSNVTINWSANSDDVVKLSGATGKKITVTAKGVGEAVLTASAAGKDETQTDNITIKVLADAFNSISLDKTSYTVGVNASVTASAKANYTSGDEAVAAGDVSWYTDDPETAEVSSTGVIKGIKAGKTKLHAEYNGVSVSADVEVTPTALSSLSLNKTTASVNVNSTVTLTATPSFTGESKTPTYTWTSSAPTVATVTGTGASVTVTGKTAGTATITVKATYDGVEKTKTCTVTVKNTPKDVYISLEDVDDSGYVFSSKDADGVTAYANINSIVGSYSYIKFGTGSGCGTLYASSDSTANSNKVSTSAKYYYSSTSPLLRNICFVPDEDGEYAINYTAYNASNVEVASGTITIEVSGFMSGDIVITLDDDDEYSFSDDLKSEKASAVEIIEDFLYDNTEWDDDYDYDITFTGIDDGDCGTLYTDDSKKDDVTRKMTFYSNPEDDDYDIADLYFVPEDSGTWEADFTIEYEYKSGSKTKSDEIEGTLQIVVPGDEDDDVVTVTLDDEEEGYFFDDKTEKEGKSAKTLLSNAVGKTCSYIKFTQSTSSKKIGTLYDGSGELNRNAISSSTKVYISSLDGIQLADLYFEPEVKGVCEIPFTAYNSSNKIIMSGTLNIVVGSGSTAGDIYFTGTTSSSIELSESAFLKWFQGETSSSYKLAYVTFDDAEDYEGTFRSGSSSSSNFAPGEDSDYKFYSSTYNTSSSGAKYLKNVIYKASKYDEVFTVDFTCAGGTSASATSTKKSGTLCIFVTDEEVPAINYAITSTSLEFDESDFISVYKTAMDTTSSSAKFYVQLLDVPEKGTLYYNYTSSSKPGTKLTASNVSSHDLYINGASSLDSVEDITYIPAAATGAYSIQYMAYSNSGSPLYVGTIILNYASEKAMSCQSSGYTFKALDFYSPTDSDPIMYVTFSQPTTGGLFVNYANGSGTAVTSSVKLYTIYSTYGTYPISALTYIPKAGYSGTVSISYSAYTASGSKFNGTIKMTVSTKTASSTFTDVTAKDVGTWAADAIDFACDWGLVQGTDLTKKLYSPYNTMKRCDMVLILYRAAGSPKATGTCAYTDVPTNAYYYDSALWASQNNIMTGVVTGKSYNPNGAITRQDFATILYNYTKYRGISVTNSGSLTKYTDASSVSAYAKDAVTWAVARGYITSMSTTELILSPATSANRAQVATLLHRYFTY